MTTLSRKLSPSALTITIPGIGALTRIETGTETRVTSAGNTRVTSAGNTRITDISFNSYPVLLTIKKQPITLNITIKE